MQTVADVVGHLLYCQKEEALNACTTDDGVKLHLDGKRLNPSHPFPTCLEGILRAGRHLFEVTYLDGELRHSRQLTFEPEGPCGPGEEEEV